MLSVQPINILFSLLLLPTPKFINVHLFVVQGGLALLSNPKHRLKNKFQKISNIKR